MYERSYSELIDILGYEDRFRYLRVNGSVGHDTFGYDRYLNQVLYKSPEWRKTRNFVIARDNGCDLAHSDYPIPNGSRILIHHINPITVNDILDRNPKVFDLNNLIVVTHRTHEAIHYGDESLLPQQPIVRSPNDTCPWR